MSVSPLLRPLALGVGLVLFAAACSASSHSAGTTGDGLAFNDAQDAGLSESCDQLDRTLREAGGLFSTLDQNELMAIIEAVDGELAVATAAHLARGGEPVEGFRNQVDEATYSACGLPLYSVAGLMETYSNSAKDLPCFVYSPQAAVTDKGQYVALDCATGEEVVFQPTGDWIVASEVAPPTTQSRQDPPAQTTTTEQVRTTETTTTTTIVETTTTTTTQAEAPTEPTTTQSDPDTPSNPDTQSDPDTPPVTDENGEVVQTTLTTINESI